ncbi:PIR protein [Plasmodium ovale]|uniref:PIR protein n=1 Tax=Plasmodium ovale TaxID=36330 RepID=A0A1D3JE34_PLAOA|nr:PIR protein [Plasmodium ovale]
MSDDYENNLPATSYFNYMNNESIKENEYAGNTFNLFMDSASPEIKTIGSLFYRNFSYLRYKGNEWDKRCSNLNYWLNLKKVKHREAHSNGHDDLWKPIEQLWAEIDDFRHPDFNCDRKHSNESSTNIEKRYALDRFCENRNYLKRKCEISISTKYEYDENCINLTKYVNKHYDIFLKQDKCLPDKRNSHDNDPFFISEDCSLYDMNKTFPEYIIQNREILEKNNTRKAIKFCSDLEKLSTHGTEGDELAPVTLEVTETPSQSSPQNNSLYGGLAFMGFFPALFYVYKFTSLGTWLRSRIMNSELALANKDDQESYNSIDDPSDIFLTNPENKEYFLGYKPA